MYDFSINYIIMYINHEVIDYVISCEIIEMYQYCILHIKFNLTIKFFNTAGQN